MESPLRQYTQTRLDGCTAVSEAVQAGLTQEKDVFFLLRMSTDVVQLWNSEKLRTTHSAAVQSVVAAALKKRDPGSGMQVFLICMEDGKTDYVQSAKIRLAPKNSHTPVWTRDAWNAAQSKKLKKA